MSTLPYLQRQLKPRLQELAAQTSLQGYQKYNKSDLATALDDHLRANQSRYARISDFNEFYARLARGGRASSEGEGTPSTTARKSPRRARGRAAETEESEDESSPPPTTPARRTTRARQEDGSPLSPRLVTDAIDQQTERMRQKMTDAWQSSGMTEWSDSLRAMLSSVKAVETLVLLLEGACMLNELVPMRYLATLPAVDAVWMPEVSVKVPDLFILVDSSFWAPFSLWLLTSLVIPLGVAYFFNLSLKAAQGGRGRAAAQRTSFDPLSFNIAKALIAYRVYGMRFAFCDVYSRFSAQKVDSSLPGGWAGVLTGSAIGVVGTLYEAILRK